MNVQVNSMVLNNQVALIGPIHEIDKIEWEFQQLIQKNKDVQSVFLEDKLYKRMRRLKIERTIIHNNEKHLILFFRCKGIYIQEILDRFRYYPVTTRSFSENEKNLVWIVSKEETIITHKFIPTWAIKEIFIDFMNTTDSPMMLDSYQTIRLDRNTRELVIRDQKLDDDDLYNIFFTESIKRQPVYHYLSQYVTSLYHSCINRYDELYAYNKEIWEGERTSPIGLFIVTFGVLGIIAIALLILGLI